MCLWPRKKLGKVPEVKGLTHLKIEKMNPCRIAYVRRTGAYGAGNNLVMEKIKNFAKENGLFGDDAVILAIAQDDPRSTPPDQCRYDACLVLDKKRNVPTEQISCTTLSGGSYAVFEAIHTVEGVQKAWTQIYSQCESENMKIDVSKPIIERYAMQMVKAGKCELLVPII